MARKPGQTVRQPWMPAPYEAGDTAALQALANGTANDGQQRRALHWIIYSACKTYDLPYIPGPNGDRETAFAAGMMHVGQQIVKQLKIAIPNK